jgi:L-malate glycosyltransferase
VRTRPIDTTSDAPLPKATDRVHVASVARLLHVAGDENRLLQTSLAFDPDRVEHVVFIIDPADGMSERERNRWSDMLDAYREQRCEVVDLSTSSEGRVASVRDRAALVARLAREFRRRRIDVVDTRMGLPMTLALPAAKLAGVPVVTLTTYYTNTFDPPVRYLVGQTCLLGIDALISDAQATLDDFDRWRWTDRPELVLIQNGIQPATTDLSVEEARAALGLPTDPDITVIGQISRVMPRKAFDVFLQAARIASDTDPDLVFAAIGFVEDEHRDHMDELERLRDELGLRDTVHFISYAGPVAHAHRAIDVFAHISHADSSPIAIHEAMSAGKPSVISAIPGNRELMDDGRTGLLVPPGDPTATAEAILRLSGDPALAEQLGAGARRRYEERHRPARMASEHLELYERLLAAKGRSGRGGRP